MPAARRRSAALRGRGRCRAATPRGARATSARARVLGARPRARGTSLAVRIRSCRTARARHWDWIGLAAGVAMRPRRLRALRLHGLAGAVAAEPGGVRGSGSPWSSARSASRSGDSRSQRQRARRDADTIARQLRQLEDAQRALVQQEKLAAIGRLAAGVAHEVRNPLGVIRASAAMVRESFAPGDDCVPRLPVHRATRATA